MRFLMEENQKFKEEIYITSPIKIEPSTNYTNTSIVDFIVPTNSSAITIFNSERHFKTHRRKNENPTNIEIRISRG